MDTTSLYVGIEVDMSGFVDAMNRVSATLIATAELFETVAVDIKKSFMSIGQASEGTESSFKKYVEFGLKTVDVFDAIGKSVKGASHAIKGFGAFAEGAEEGSGFGPWGALAAGVTSMLVASKLTSPNDNTQTNRVGTISHRDGEVINFPEVNNRDVLTLGAFKVPVDQTGSAVPGVPQSGGSVMGINGPEPVYDPNAAQKDNAPQQLPIILKPVEDEDASQQLMDEFQKNYEKVLAKIQEMNKSDKPVIKVQADVDYKGDKTKDDKSDTDKKVDGYDKVGKAAAGADEKIKRINEEIRESTQLQMTLQNAAVGSFEAIGDAIGKMATGQKGVNPLAAIMKQMADALKKYGEFLITAGTAMLFGGDPLGAAKVGEGIALEAVSSAMGAVKLASGGIVSGSTFANIGEYAGASHNPEVVAPLDKLKNMLGGSGQFPSMVQLYARGDGLQATIDRSGRNSNFVNGFPT